MITKSNAKVLVKYKIKNQFFFYRQLSKIVVQKMRVAAAKCAMECREGYRNCYYYAIFLRTFLVHDWERLKFAICYIIV